METSLKSKVLTGMFWRFLERSAAQIVTFIVSIILARLLEPEDYGVVALTTIFITIANVFVTEGFGKALIQKKEVDQVDYSSVFFFNCIFSIVLYLLIFIGSPSIGNYFGEPLLSSTLRVLGLRLPLASINSIQHAYVSRNIMFKLFFKATIIGTITSAIVGITMAYMGFGVWALVAQY